MHSQPPKSPTPLIRGERQRRRSPNSPPPYQGESPCQGSCRGTLETSLGSELLVNVYLFLAFTIYKNIEGLFIREFTNGWAVYNRSGQAQTITLPSSATRVSDRGDNPAAVTHILPDLDGEIYLTTKSPADVNGDER